jgi:hypothetical protein
MAVITLKIVRTQHPARGGVSIVTADIEISGLYEAGGFELYASQLGLKRINSLAPVQNADYGAVWFPVDGEVYMGKIKLFADSSVSIGGASAGSEIVEDVIPMSVEGGNTNAVTGSAGWPPDDATGYKEYADSTNIDTAVSVFTTQPIYPTNLSIALRSVSGTHDLTGISFAIVGTFNGAAQLSTITMPPVSLAYGKYVLVYGTKPFDTITSVTPTGGDTGLVYYVGAGAIVGLNRALATKSVADILKVTYEKTVQSETASTNYTSFRSNNYFKTEPTVNGVNFGAIALDYRLCIKYKASVPAISGGTVTQSTEITGTVNTTIRVTAIGE